VTRWRATRKAAVAVALVTVVVALIGATFQGVSTALERRRFERPGRMVDVGEHQLHVHCTGAGSPTVVLEAPLGGLSASWESVQPRIAEGFLVCSYDRSGLGWSETGDGPFTPERATAELRAALAAAGAARPFILVGRGFGAALASSFARRYPSDTAGLVLVDPPDATSLAPSTPSPWLARLGVLRTVAWFLPPDTSPMNSQTVHAFNYRPDHLARTMSEARAWRAVVSDDSNPPFADANVRVITSGDQSDPGVADGIVQALRTLSPAR
jgi:pimeloyl-ACP methyl ester carboxylesterase